MLVSDEFPELRLARVLAEQRDVVRGSLTALERRINEANGRGHKPPLLDRRKLRRIIDRKDVSLTLRELRALDVFLRPFGEGLSDRPIFDKPNPLQSLVESGKVTIVLGAYPRSEARRNDLSRWDVHSMAYVLRNIELRRPGTDLEIRDILARRALVPPSYLEAQGRALCSIGSPRACFATEWLLAEMFGVSAFAEPESSRVPLRFLWSPAIALPYSSAFSPDPESLEYLDEKLAYRLGLGQVRGVLEVNGNHYEDSSPRTPHQVRGQSYGVVVTQQRASGDVWMVLAGLTGPATYACALAMAAGQTGAVPESGDTHSPIRWDVVEATVELSVEREGDQRIVRCAKVVDSGLVDPGSPMRAPESDRSDP